MNNNHFLFSALMFGLQLGCFQSTTLKKCSPECPRGTICNEAEAVCVSSTQKSFEGNISGRSFDLVATKSTVFISAQNQQGDILVSEFSGTGLNHNVVLAEFGTSSVRKTVIDANDTTLVVGWRESDRYLIAFRDIRGSRFSWQFRTIAGVYRASDDFDLVHVGERFSIVFRDVSGGVFALASDVQEEESWSLELVDAGSERNNSNCESSDVGYDIHAINREARLSVVYHDRGCGALKIAHEEKGQWNDSVVDAGVFSSKLVDVGRQPSVSINDAGEASISYLSSENILLFSSERDGTFTRQIVDGGKNTDVLSREVINKVGYFSSLLTRDKTTKIVYFDGTDQRLLVAENIDDKWEVGPVLEGDFIVGMNSKVVNFENSDWVLTERLERDTDFVSTLIAVELQP